MKKPESTFFPMFFDMTDRKIVIAGAGTIASRRAESLTGFGADIVVVAPEGTKIMERLEQEGALRWQRRSLQEADLDGAAVVLAATSDRGLNDQIVKWCRDKKILVNHAGDKEQCDFYFPGLARKGEVVIGATASGKSHSLARRLSEGLRDWLEQFEI